MMQPACPIACPPGEGGLLTVAAPKRGRCCTSAQLQHEPCPYARLLARWPRRCDARTASAVVATVLRTLARSVAITTTRHAVRNRCATRTPSQPGGPGRKSLTRPRAHEARTSRVRAEIELLGEEA
jgi:hypothetical protein